MIAETPDEQQFLRSVRPGRILLPVLLGLLAVAYLFWKQFDAQQFKAIQWTGWAWAWIGAAFLLLLLRHFFYTLRLRAVTRGAFSWKKCAQLMVLWEFSASVTPTSKGGPAVMLFVMTKEKLSAGRTLSAVFYSMLADTGFFSIMLPIMLLIYGPAMLYPGVTHFNEAGLAGGAFLVTYAMMATYFVTLMFFVFIRPRYAGIFLQWLSRQRLLRRWSNKIAHLGHDFMIASAELQREPWTVHLAVIAGTLGVWFCKFAMINCLIIAVVPGTPMDGSTQMFVFARLVAMFIIMAFSPTPGGAGLAEVALSNFISDYVPLGIGLVVALLWRGMAYYGYLIAGAIVVPAWINTVLKKKNASASSNEKPAVIV
jgi:uncharacterized protein (TIRG00374 family)